MAELLLTDTSLKIVGDGPIHTPFTAEMVRRLFKLPSHPALVWYGEATITAFDVLSRRSKESSASFDRVVSQSPELRKEHEYKLKHFAAYAHPTTGTWPDSDALMVLETIPVDLPFLLFISWMMDGRIRLGYVGENLVQMTPEEFQASMGRNYREYCEEQLPLGIDKAQRALALLAIESPKKSVVSFINKYSDVEKKTLVYWQDDQIDMYLTRNELSHIATEPEET